MNTKWPPRHAESWADMLYSAEERDLQLDFRTEGRVMSDLTDGTLQSRTLADSVKSLIWRGVSESLGDPGLQEWSEWRRLSFFLLIFTKSLWYPPLHDPVTGDSREVFKRTAVFTSRSSHYILSYVHPVPPRLPSMWTDKLFSAGGLKTGWQHSLLQTTVPTNLCSPHMLDCTPTTKLTSCF